MKYKKINLDPFKYNPTHWYKMKNNPQSVVREHVSMRLFQQSRKVVKCMVNKIDQACMSVIPVLCILDKVLQ